MGKRDGRQKGAQHHAAGEHGPKTRTRNQEILRSHVYQDVHPTTQSDTTHSDTGEHRLFEDRAQHDEADKNSEKTRLSRDINRHGHDREQFQVRGGKENHPRA